MRGGKEGAISSTKHPSAVSALAGLSEFERSRDRKLSDL
jgi:hypothetical protein